MADDAAAELSRLYNPPHRFTVAKCLDQVPKTLLKVEGLKATL